jgi:hypothetical protein
VTDRRLLFFGDSLVAGVGDPSGRGWVGRVVAASFGGGLPFTAYNLGVRRETSEQVAARWHSEALPRLLPEADVRIVVSFGANDTTIEHGRLRVTSLTVPWHLACFLWWSGRRRLTILSRTSASWHCPLRSRRFAPTPVLASSVSSSNCSPLKSG